MRPTCSTSPTSLSYRQERLSPQLGTGTPTPSSRGGCRSAQVQRTLWHSSGSGQTTSFAGSCAARIMANPRGTQHQSGSLPRTRSAPRVLPPAAAVARQPSSSPWTWAMQLTCSCPSPLQQMRQLLTELLPQQQQPRRTAMYLGPPRPVGLLQRGQRRRGSEAQQRQVMQPVAQQHWAHRSACASSPCTLGIPPCPPSTSATSRPILVSRRRSTS